MKSRRMRRVKFRFIWDRMRVSLWFVPLVMFLLAVLFAWFMSWVDAQIPNENLDHYRFILSGNTDDLRGTLVSIAGVILTTAGVVFTLLSLPLSTVASQYGSRLLRVFLRDRTTQAVLGMFVFTFVYCLAAALAIPPNKEMVGSPILSVSVGLLLMLATFGSLIILIQHISTMLQAPNIAAAAGRELLDVIRVESRYNSMIPVEGNQEGLETTAKYDEKQGYQVRLNDLGYLQFIDPDLLLALAEEKDLVIQVLRPSNNFIEQNTVVALVWPSNGVNERLVKQIRRSFLIGNQRTPPQDIEFAVNQLVEVAERAMSPAINDPFTAMTCLDYLGIGLARFVQQYDLIGLIYGRGGILRIIFQPQTFEVLLNSAFDMLRHASCDNATVLLYILETLEKIGEGVKSTSVRQELLRHVKLVQEESRAGSLIDTDRKLIQSRGEALQLKLEAV